ncbi:MAG: hypothetical protein AAF726_08475 [Planctomycetota bacterium]
MTARISLAALALLAPPFVAPPVLAQSVDVVVEPGQFIPGIGIVNTALANAVNDSGTLAAAVYGTEGAGVVVDGAVRQPFGPLPGGGNFAGSQFMFLDSAGRLAISGETVFFAGDAVLLLDGVRIAETGDPIGEPGFVWDEFRIMGFSDTGLIALRGIAVEMGTGSELDAFATVEVDAAGNVVQRSVLALEGRPLPAGLGDFRGPVRGVHVAQDGRVLWGGSRQSGSFDDDDFILLDQTLLVLEGTTPSPFPGLPWRIPNHRYWLDPVAGTWLASNIVAGEPGGFVTAVLVDGVADRTEGDRPSGVDPFAVTDYQRVSTGAASEQIYQGSVSVEDARYRSVLMVDDDPLLWSGFDEIGGQRIRIQETRPSGSGRYVAVTAQQNSQTLAALVDRFGTPDACGAVPDLFEPNDTCFTATDVTVGTLPTTNVSRSNDDWYRIPIDADEILDVRALHTGRDSEVDLEVFIGDCGNLVLRAAATQPASDEGLFVSNNISGPADLFVRVFVPDRSPSDCAEYRLTFDIRQGDACVPGLGFVDDALEPNNGCRNALAIEPGVYEELKISQVAADHFEVLVPPSSAAEFEIRTSTPMAILRCSILEPGCSLLERDVANESFGGAFPRLVYTNVTDEPERAVLRIELTSQLSVPQCATYELTCRTLGDSIGATVCSAQPNSTGVPSEIAAYGDDRAIANLFELRATSLPPGAAGYFLASMNLDFVPGAGGSQGDLCVGNPVGRIVDSVQLASPLGVSAWRVDLTSIPQPTGAVQVVPGTAWYFQLWYRDANPGPTSNFSEAAGILFR